MKRYLLFVLFLLATNCMPALYATQQITEQTSQKEKEIDEKNMALLEEIRDFFVRQYGKKEKKPITKLLKSYAKVKNKNNDENSEFTEQDKNLGKTIEEQLLGDKYKLSRRDKKKINQKLDNKVENIDYSKEHLKYQYKKVCKDFFGKSKTDGHISLMNKHIIQDKLTKFNDRVKKAYEDIPPIEVFINLSDINSDGGYLESYNTRSIRITVKTRNGKKDTRWIKVDKRKIRPVLTSLKELDEKLRKHIKDNKDREEDIKKFVQRGSKEEDKKKLKEYVDKLNRITRDMYKYKYEYEFDWTKAEKHYGSLLEIKIELVYLDIEGEKKITEEEYKKIILDFNTELAQDIEIFNRMIQECEKDPASKENTDHKNITFHYSIDTAYQDKNNIRVDICIQEKSNIEEIKLDIKIDKEIPSLLEKLGHSLSKYIPKEEIAENPKKAVKNFEKELKELSKEKTLTKDLDNLYMYFVQISQFRHGTSPAEQYMLILKRAFFSFYQEIEGPIGEQDLKKRILIFNEKRLEELKLFNAMIEEYVKKLNKEEIPLKKEIEQSILDEVLNNGLKDNINQTPENQTSTIQQEEQQDTPSISASTLNKKTQKQQEVDNQTPEDQTSTIDQQRIKNQGNLEDSEEKEPEDSTALLLIEKNTMYKDRHPKKIKRKKNTKHFLTVGFIFIIGIVAIELITLSKRKSKEREDKGNDNENK